MKNDIVFIVYFFVIFWWTALFVVLPLGVRSHWEAGIEVPGGGDPASPVNPQLKKKFLTTTWIASALTLLFWSAVHFQLIAPPALSRF